MWMASVNFYSAIDHSLIHCTLRAGILSRQHTRTRAEVSALTPRLQQWINVQLEWIAYGVWFTTHEHGTPVLEVQVGRETTFFKAILEYKLSERDIISPVNSIAFRLNPAATILAHQSHAYFYEPKLTEKAKIDFKKQLGKEVVFMEIHSENGGIYICCPDIRTNDMLMEFIRDNYADASTIVGKK